MFPNTMSTAALALFLSTTTILALPTARSALTAAQILAIAPTSNSCSGATHADECMTAAQAVIPINFSFANYQITDAATQAALLATMALESGEFKFAHHYFPSPNPGQGTRNMQSAAFNLKYAQSIPALATALPAAQAAGAESVLDLLLTYSEYDYGSAAWFLTSQCNAAVISGLKTAGTAAFSAYCGCIGTSVTDDRTKYYASALKALGVSATN